MKSKNLLAPEVEETLTLTREEWEILDMALCGYIALCSLKAAPPKKENVQSILRRIRSLWFEDRHERRVTGYCRVCGCYGSDCTGRQRPRK
ncbi:MAG: hypothetical protein EKK48_24590 [Candidatus Melainabacteria bacterium]|nr:MAG: hypothetical protein EKK48_24590 [Candidatus Melainabacteria bacterium]